MVYTYLHMFFGGGKNGKKGWISDKKRTKKMLEDNATKRLSPAFYSFAYAHLFSPWQSESKLSFAHLAYQKRDGEDVGKDMRLF